MINHSLNSKVVLFSTAALTSFFSCQPQQKEDKNKSKENQQPNILYIFTDQQTINAMSAYGNPYVNTPYMDDLARLGVRFTKSYCTSPVSSPSRSSMITSRMPHTTDVNYNNMRPDSTLVNMGQWFHKAGYKTVWGGKWHLPQSYPTSRGIDTLPGFELMQFMEPERISGRGDYTDGPLADAAVEFIEQNNDYPFLLCLSFHNPHDICYVPRNYKEFDSLVNIESAPPLPYNFEINPEEPEFIESCRQRNYYGNELKLASDFGNKEWRTYLWHYYRMTERVDKEIGKVIEALEKADIDKNTLIIFSSDHGDGVAAHRWAAKLSLYQESVAVPFIVTWFGKTPEGKVDSTHLVSGLDIFPTMCDYAGIEPPAGVKGQSLRPLIEGKDADWREYVVTELAPFPKEKEKMGRMVRTSRYKYNLYSYGKNNEQLFDLKNDPGEKHNLAYKPEMKEIIQDHRDMLKEWTEKTGDFFQLQGDSVVLDLEKIENITSNE